MMQGSDDNQWRTSSFRQGMVGKIEEAVMACGAPTTKNALEMENQVFSKAKSRDEYMSFVARLIIHIKEMGSKKTGPGMAGQQNPAQGQRKFPLGNAGMGQMGGVQQNLGMMNQLNQMGGMGMMNQPGMVQMSPGPSMMQAGGLSQSQQQHPHQMNPQSNPQNQMINQQNFIQQAQMQNVQMQNSQLQPGQMQNSPMGNVQLQNQQLQQLQNSQLQNAQLQNAQLQNQQMHNQQIQNAQQIQNSQMQNQQMQNVQMQNMQMQNAQQLQDHMRNAQMGGVPMGSMQNNQLGNVQLPNSQLGNVQIGNPQMGNPQMGNSQMGNPQLGSPQMGNSQMPGENQMRSVQMQPGQQIHNVQMSGQLSNPNMQNMMNPQQQSQQMLATRTLGNRMGQATMANQLSNMAKQQPGPRGMHRAPNVDSVVMNSPYNSPGGGMMSRVTPSQFMPSQAGPGGMVQTPSPGPPNSQNSGYANSPAQSTLMPSPAAPVMSSGNMRPYQSQLGVPSPGPSLNTPLMNPATPSPRNPEDQACIEKIKELRKYTDLLQRMIAKIGNDDVEKSSKMKKLLEILTNPNQRVSMEILLKCEVALKKMERQQNDPGGMLGPTPQPPPMKDQSQVSPFQQVMDSLNNALRTPAYSHTLLRTFRPTVEALTGHSFASSFQQYEEDGSSDSESTENDVPPLLKRELRTLDSRFHVSVVRKGGGICRLSCNLNEPRLPRVPPLKISVRSDYPFEPPVVVDLNRDYSSTVFLSSVARAFKSRFHHLTRNHSVIELLFMWEMCVRQASNPNVKFEKSVPVNRGTVALGL